MERSATAEWNGALQGGKGKMSTASGVLADSQYSFATRFEDGKGTNPEELIAAAHAGCFSMALSAVLGEAKLTPDYVKTQAKVTLSKVEGGFAITKIHLVTEAKVPGADEAAFKKAADGAKAGCPISKLFANNAEITLDAKLVS
jgi:osmotically inducible protein OsmC